MKGKAAPPPGGGAKERGINELIRETWALIDQAKKSLLNSELSENDRIRWAGVQASAIGTLNRLLWKAGEGRVDEEDLASILSKVPEKYAKIVRSKVKAAESKKFSPKGQEHILKILRNCKRDQPMEIYWRDASGSRNVSVISHRVVVTPVKMIGWFDSLRKDAETGILHLLTYWMDSDGNKNMDSTPVPIIVDVKLLKAKEAKKRCKDKMNRRWTSPLPGGGTKVVFRRRNG